MYNITVGIPAYNAHKTLHRTLQSIISLSNLSEVKVIIVDDASDQNYEEIIKQFQPLIDIALIRLVENVGPGIARNVILDNCDTEFIAFIDADDEFITPNFLVEAIEQLNTNTKAPFYMSTFYTESKFREKIATLELDWLHGKVYRLSAIQNKNIRFSKKRFMEDLEFNLELFLSYKELPVYSNTINYLYHSNPESIIGSSFKSYTEIWLKSTRVGIEIRNKVLSKPALVRERVVDYLKKDIVKYYAMADDLYRQEKAHPDRWEANQLKKQFFYRQLNRYYNQIIKHYDIIFENTIQHYYVDFETFYRHVVDSSTVEKKKISLQNQMIYQVYIRNHTKEGTFQSFIKDIDRIKQLGADIVHFLPIHPIGVKNRKGTLGCPYSIQNYREINPEYGTLEDFHMLIEAMHEKNLKVMIDVVYNHTSHDSVLLEKFPDSYLRNLNGEIMPKVMDWVDVADLIHDSKELEQELIDTLVYWASLGVDGFRCDVANIIPLSFWKAADIAVSAINPDIIWLAETVHPEFAAAMKSRDILYETDADLYQVFDIQYSYDTFYVEQEYYRGNKTLQECVTAMKLQEFYLPLNANKMRFLENHDQPRFMTYNLDPKMYTAMMFCLKGTPLIYAGQEALNKHLPSLFDKDVIDLSNEGISEFIATLAKIKKHILFAEGKYEIEAIDDCLIISYTKNTRELKGVFNLRGKKTKVSVPDGLHKNLIDDQWVTVHNNVIDWDFPVIIELTDNYLY